MKIHEFQAKQVLTQFSVPVPKGEVVSTPEEARAAAERLGGKVVVKAQIHAGGRGKAGGVKLVTSSNEAAQVATKLLGKALVTGQTGPGGRVVKRLLIEESLDVAKEFYLGIVLDRASARPVFLASSEGGVEIEITAAKKPEKILKAHIDPDRGLEAYQARKLAFNSGLGPQVKGAARVFTNLYHAFQETDASMVEINPFVLTRDGRIIALDAKIDFDDNGLYRHKNLMQLRDIDEEDPLEVRATEHGLNYIKLEGNVGCMVNGAGLAMATMDIIQYAGGFPANFLDVGGGASEDQVRNAFQILLADTGVRAVLINIFGGIMRCDIVASGVVAAAKALSVKVPIVVRLEGTNAEMGGKILEESNLNFTVARNMKDAAEKVVKLAK